LVVTRGKWQKKCPIGKETRGEKPPHIPAEEEGKREGLAFSEALRQREGREGEKGGWPIPFPTVMRERGRERADVPIVRQEHSKTTLGEGGERNDREPHAREGKKE